jgi:hypothetical protein
LTTEKENTMRRSLVLLGVTEMIALAGCGPLDGSGFEASTPTAETVALNVPATAAASGALTAGGVVEVKRGALLGEIAGAYQLTYAITHVVNGGTGAVLVLVRTIVAFPPSSVDGDTAVWGPHAEPLDQNAWRLTVTRLDRNVFSWRFDGKPKTAADSAFVTILSGTHTRAVDAGGHVIEGFGSGTFVVDWDAAQTLPQHDDNVGVASFTYSRLDPGATETIGVDFRGIQDKTTREIYDAVYAYTATPGAGGDLEYGANQDSFPGPGPTGTAKETLTLHSRWQETGAGRTDYQVSGAEVTAAVGGPVTASECWDASFASQYKNVSYDASQDWGAESSCAFPTADFSTLAP